MSLTSKKGEIGQVPGGAVLLFFPLTRCGWKRSVQYLPATMVTMRLLTGVFLVPLMWPWLTMKKRVSLWSCGDSASEVSELCCGDATLNAELVMFWFWFLFLIICLDLSNG